MSSKQVTLIVLFLSLVLLGLSRRTLIGSLTQESVFEATDHYAQSGHADRLSRSFTNWDTNDPPVIPATCAGCHSTTGFLSYLGEGDSPAGVVAADVMAGTVITCEACHNPSAHALSQVAFHSGATVTGVGSEAVCLVCHQARQSTDGLDLITKGAREDEILPDQGFINPHYNFAASTQYGTETRSGYQYPGAEYARFFSHAANARTCIDCHNAHSLQVEPRRCAVCHSNVVTVDDFRAIRMQTDDFDGDGNTSEGIQAEIEALHDRLYHAVQQYAYQTTGNQIVYADQFPYFFIDSNGDGSAGMEETVPSNRYNAWTPRLLRAAYNYQFVKKDNGGYVHNPYYVLQLLFDSLNDLNGQNELVPRPSSP